MNWLITTFADACSGGKATVPDTSGTNGTLDFCTNLPKTTSNSGTLHNILQIVIGTLAVVAVLMIVIAGLNIVTAGGDSAKVAKARGTIIFALVGLAVAIFADVIVGAVLGRL